MGKIQTRHGQLYYTTTGTGSPLVLIHGNSYTSATQERLARLFADEHEVFSIDLLGHGQSARPDNLFRLNYFVMQGEALADLLYALFPTTSVAIFGMSAGGITALNAICEQADRIAALILDGVFHQVSAATVAAHRQSVATMSRTWDSYMRKQHGAEWWPQLRSGIEQTIAHLEVAGTIVTPCLDCVRVPALILQGGRDPFVPDEQSHAIVAKISGARFIYDAEAGHLLAWKDPVAFRETARAFLREIGYTA
jgi:pimeloyl-ACP methyl ester carboxylesterase